jgi:hypothetical protein
MEADNPLCDSFDARQIVGAEDIAGLWVVSGSVDDGESVIAGSAPF